MNVNEPSKVKRFTAPLAAIGIGIIQTALALIFVVFFLGQCVGDAKDMLACVGVGDTPAATLSLRAFDQSNPNDVRMGLSLLRMANVGSLPVDKLQAVIVQDAHVNAATVGDSVFVFFEGLARASVIQLDAIMAHEVAHACLGHCDKSADRESTVSTITKVIGTLVGADDTAKREVRSWAVAASLPAYSRDQEFEADQEAVRLLRSAGYSGPERMLAGTLTWLKSLEGDTGGGFFDSHPATSERIERLLAGRSR